MRPGWTRCADLLLAISESSRQEGIAWLDFAHDACVNISTAADPHFKPQAVAPDDQRALRAARPVPDVHRRH